MITKRICGCLLMIFAVLSAGMPAQAAMVGTAQMQAKSAAVEPGNIAQQREWIRTQLVEGGVGESDAQRRVAGMTDAQVVQIHQRIDEAPAGGADAIVVVILVLVITELMGYTDIVPGWPAE